MRYLVLVSGLLAAACGGGDDGGGGGFDCSEPFPAGSYRLSYRTLDGDCGDIPAQTLVFTGEETLAAGSSDTCDTSTTQISSCEVAVETVCYDRDVTMTAVGSWERTSPTTSDGTFTFHGEAFDGSFCTGTYAGSIRPL